MTKTRITGRTLSFNGPLDVTYQPDGALLVEDGVIIAAGDAATVPGGDVDIDHRPHLILPGFIDPHIHFPQQEVLGAYAGNLLEWLNNHTFPAEAAFADAAHAARMAVPFFDALIRHGTTTVCAFCSVHPASADAFFKEAERRGMAVIGGKVMMDRNAPEGVLDTAERGYEETKAGIARWHGRGRAEYAITPRFAITSSEAQLEAAGALADEFPNVKIQTHMSENMEEIETVKRLFPGQRDYLDVYQRFGLVTDRTLLGHSIHLTARERAVMAETQAVAVHCPTSNLFLGSGLYDRTSLRDAVATDIGGGTSFSMLRTLDEAYKIQQLSGVRLHPFSSFDWATRGNAAALGRSDIGTLEVGTAADFVVLDPRAIPEMALRHDRVECLEDELFLLQTCGDDRAVAQTYIGGKAMKLAVSGA